MAIKTHRSQVKRERNAVKDKRPSAKLSYARIPVQKACFVLDAIRGKDVNTALGIVTYNPRYASDVIEKLLKSAVANAETNNNMAADGLYVAECYAMNGPIMKRIHPRAQGRAYRILKRMCHIIIVLDDKNAPANKAAATEDKAADTDKEKTDKKAADKDAKKADKKPAKKTADKAAKKPAENSKEAK